MPSDIMIVKIMSKFEARMAARLNHIPSSPKTYITEPAAKAQERIFVYTRQPERPLAMVETALLSITHTSIDERTITSSGTAKTRADFTETAAFEMSGETRK